MHGRSNSRQQSPPVRKEGFADVANWIALDSDNETFIYRKFDELAARNLLYFQAELLVIEKQLNELDDCGVESQDMDLKDAMRTWETLTDQCDRGDREALTRMALIEKSRHKLRQYHEILLMQSQVTKLSQPNGRVLDAYKTWFLNPFPVLGGLSKTFLNAKSDLVTVNTPPESDYLSSFLRRHWPAKEELSRDGRNRIGRFDEQSVSIVVALVNIVAAAVLLVGPIVGLYFATHDAVKLGMLALFTVVFALSVGLMTNARRAELFAATAAYAAVLVVFVSGDISNSQRGKSS